MYQRIRLADWVFEVFLLTISVFVVLQIDLFANRAVAPIIAVGLTVMLSLCMRLALNGSFGMRMFGCRTLRNNSLLLAWPLLVCATLIVGFNFIYGYTSYFNREDSFFNATAFMASPLEGSVMIWGRLAIYYLLKLNLPNIRKINEWEDSLIVANAR